MKRDRAGVVWDACRDSNSGDPEEWRIARANNEGELVLLPSYVRTETRDLLLAVDIPRLRSCGAILARH